MTKFYDNHTSGIMTKVNQIAESLGIEPYQFTAILEKDTDYNNDLSHKPWNLTISYSDRDSAKIRTFVKAITGDQDMHALEGNNSVDILHTLCKALKKVTESQQKSVSETNISLRAR